MLVVAPASVGMWALSGPISGTLYGTMKAAPVIAHLAPSIAFHILGAAWASNLNFALVAAINIFFLYRNGIPFPVRDSLKILLASLCMGLAGKMAALFFMDKGSIVVALLAGMAVSVLVYGTAVMLLGCMTREEAAQLPVIGKIIRKFWKG